MDPIMICFIMSTVLATPDAQNVTLQCPQVAQEEVISLFGDLTQQEPQTQTQTQTEEGNGDGGDNNDNPSSNDSDELPSCQDDNRPRPGSCRDDLDTNEEPIEEEEEEGQDIEGE